MDYRVKIEIQLGKVLRLDSCHHCDEFIKMVARLETLDINVEEFCHLAQDQFVSQMTLSRSMTL